MAEPCRAVTQGRALRGSFTLTRQGPLRTKDFARGRARGTDARARICHAENVDVAYEPANRPGWVQGTYSSLNALISAKFEFSASQLWTSFQGEGAGPGGALALSPTAPPTAPRGDTMSLPLPLPRYTYDGVRHGPLGRKRASYPGVRARRATDRAQFPGCHPRQRQRQRQRCVMGGGGGRCAASANDRGADEPQQRCAADAGGSACPREPDEPQQRCAADAGGSACPHEHHTRRCDGSPHPFPGWPLSPARCAI